MDYVIPDKATTALLLHKYQWDEERDWNLGINWFEEGEDAEMWCLGIFDNCDQVLPILNSIRINNIKKTNLKVKRPLAKKNQLISGKSLDIEKVNYDKIAIFYDGDIDKEYNIDPKNYQIYDYSLTGTGYFDKQKSIQFSEKASPFLPVFEVILYADDEKELNDKILKLESYLKMANNSTENKTAKDGMITLFEDKKIIPNDGKYYAFINETPEMPNNLKVRFNGKDNETAKITIEIRYNIKYNYNGNEYSFNDETTKYELKDVKANQDNNLSFDKIRGGTVLLTCETKDNKGTFTFHIRGNNPSKSTVENYQSTKGYSQYWFISAMTTHESSYMQFDYVQKSLSLAPIDEKNAYSGPYTSSKGQQGLPLYGGPRGFGLKQLDNWEVNGVKKYCSAEQRWNWKSNIDGSLEVFDVKVGNINSDYASWQTQVDNWNKSHKKNKITMDEQSFGANKNTETFTYSDSPIFPSLIFTGSAPVSGKHSFLDAVLIRKYNGGAYLFQLKIPKSDEAVDEDVNKKPYWELITTYGDSNKDNTSYINSVCDKN